MKTYFSTFIFLVFFGSASAQADLAYVVQNNAGTFAFCVLAGILLAVTFQFVLSSLAVAGGISAITDFRKHHHRRQSSSSSDSDNSSSDDTPIGVKISSGMGIFVMLTSAISLFFASMIAVKFSFSASDALGVLLGLLIWAGTALIMMYFDGKIISGLAGSLISTVKSGIQSGTDMIGGIFSSSEKSRLKATAKETAQAFTEEVRSEMDTDGFSEKFDEYVEKLKPQKFSLDEIRGELEQLLDEISVKSQYTPDDPVAVEKLILEVADEEGSKMDKPKKNNLKKAMKELREIRSQEGSRSSKVLTAFDRVVDGSEEKVRKFRNKVGDYLKSSDIETLQPDQLDRDLDRILHHPKEASTVVNEKVSGLNRDTLLDLLSANERVDRKDAEKYVGKVEDALDRLQTQFEEKKESAGQKTNEMKGRYQERKAESKEEMERRRNLAQVQVRNWFNRMNRPELRYDVLEKDVKRMMDDPKASPKILRNRLSKMDSKTLKALITNNDQISEDQVDEVVNRIERARDQVIAKANEIEQQVRDKVSEAEYMALAQAEAARKTAASAAWWVFGTLVVSGAASALGGVLAFTF